MFCERATAKSQALSLATGFSPWGQGQLLVYAGALSQGSWVQHFPQHRYEPWHPACCLQQLLPPLLYDYSFPVITTNVTPPMPAVKADVWCRASVRAYPRRRWTEPNALQWTPERGCSSTYLPAVSCSCMSRALQDSARLREEADGKGEPSHQVLFRPVTDVHHVTGTASSDPWERAVQGNNKKQFYWEWAYKLVTCRLSGTWSLQQGTTDALRTQYRFWTHEKGKWQNRGLNQIIKFNYIFIGLCIFHCIMIYIGYSIM